MIEIRYNVFDEYERAALDEKICSVWISSADEEESCSIVYNILTTVFQNSQVVFRATGDPDNVKDVLEVLTNCNPIYFKGESKKKFFIEFIKKNPEVHAEISDKKTLKNILRAYSWTNTATELRLLYVLKESQIDDVFKVLKENVYDSRSHITLLWPHLNCMVENVPEVKNHNTFNLIFREEYFDEIKCLLSNY